MSDTIINRNLEHYKPYLITIDNKIFTYLSNVIKKSIIEKTYYDKLNYMNLNRKINMIRLNKDDEIPEYIHGFYIEYNFMNISPYKYILYCKDDIKTTEKYNVSEFFKNINPAISGIDILNINYSLFLYDIKTNKFYKFINVIISLLLWLCFINYSDYIIRIDNTRCNFGVLYKQYVYLYEGYRLIIQFQHISLTEVKLIIHFTDGMYQFDETAYITLNVIYINNLIDELSIIQKDFSYINTNIYIKYIIYNSIINLVKKINEIE